MEIGRVQWHPGFYGGIEVELRDYADQLIFQQEVELSKKPIRMDMLIIKKKSNVKIDHPIAGLFRKSNIIEYKGPDDRLSLNELFKVIGYACLYKGMSGTRDAISAKELTISVFRNAYPKELMKEIVDFGASIEEHYPGIYYVSGIIEIPLQIVVISRLDAGKCVSLKVLTRDADESDIRKFIQLVRLFTEENDRENADAVLQVSVMANQSMFDKLRKEPDMCDALRALMKEEIDAEVAAGEARGEAKGERNLAIELVYDGDLSVDKAASKLGKSTDEIDQMLKEYVNSLHNQKKH